MHLCYKKSNDLFCVTKNTTIYCVCYKKSNELLLWLQKIPRLIGRSKKVNPNLICQIDKIGSGDSTDELDNFTHQGIRLCV